LNTNQDHQSQVGRR